MGLLDQLAKAGLPSTPTVAHEAPHKPQFAEQWLGQGMELEQQGQLDEALRCYDSAVRLRPELARAHFNRGNILLDRGEVAKALDAYMKAVEFKPDSAATHYNMGSAYIALGQSDAGIAACRQAVALKPDFVDAYVTLGLALAAQGQHGEAVTNFDAALALYPNHAEAHHNRGIAMQDLGRLDQAVLSYRQALNVNPRMAEVHNNLGSALKALGNFADALASYDRALEINPNLAVVHYNLGLCLQAGGQFERAVSCYRRVLDIDADHVLARNNLGAALATLEQYEAALACFRRVIEIQPSNPDGHLNLGITLATMGQVESAILSYRKAIAIQPDNAEAHLSLGDSLKDLGQFEGALQSLRRAIEIRPDYAMAHSNLLFIFNYLADRPAEQMLEDAKRFGDMAFRVARPYTSWQNSPDVQRRLRVGFVSGDLCNHPVGYFLESVLTELSTRFADKFELFAYSNRNHEDIVSQRIRSCCSKWHSVALLPDSALAELVREDGIDILIDLSGHTAHNRLPAFAWKAAPVQVSWLGYFATTGVAAIDYLIADPWTLPQDQEAYFTEKIWRLPETRLCFTAPDSKVPVGPLPAAANGYVTFGSFNNLSKMNDRVVELWAKVLLAVPDSRLFLKYRQLSEAAVQQSCYARFATHGVEAHRLIFEGFVPRADYLASYHRVDIGLDPFPFTGGTTTVEALWMGVPVLTLVGENFLSRQGVGLLQNAGLPEWIAGSPEDYVSRAVSHAKNVQGLAALRAGLRQQVLNSTIFDARRFAGHFEAALRGMWERWCGTQSPPGSTRY